MDCTYAAEGEGEEEEEEGEEKSGILCSGEL